jgi:exodeoxyribonuclease VII small subunit
MSDDKQEMLEIPEPKEEQFEALLLGLEAVVERLERGEQSLEEALADFENGMKLSQKAEAILESAEAKIEVLIEQRDGSLKEEPFEEA